MNTRFWDRPGKNKKFLVIIYLCFDNIVLILFTFSIACVLDDGFVHAGTSVRQRRERRERRRRRAHDSKEFFINTLIFIILFIINYYFYYIIIFLGDDE